MLLVFIVRKLIIAASHIIYTTLGYPITMSMPVVAGMLIILQSQFNSHNFHRLLMQVCIFNQKTNLQGNS